MKTHVSSTPGGTDRFSYLWLVLAFVLSLFALNGTWDIALAAWLYPLFLLHFVRTQHAAIAIPGAFLVNVGATGIYFHQVGLPLSLISLIEIIILASFPTLPYLIDRLISPRIRGLASTLIFPLSFVAADYLKSLVSPFGGIGSLAYTQYGNLPLLQLLSVTGISGIVFLLTWFGSVINWAWEQHFTWPRIRKGILLYSSLLALVFFGGGARLAFFPPQAQTVRVAGISVSQTIGTQATKQAGKATSDFLSGKATQADLDTLRTAFTKIDNDLLARSQREASAGAKIVAWPECGAEILQEDKPALLVQAAALAQKMHIYLDMGLCVATRQAPHVQDQAILIDPQGQVLWTYNKARPVPGLDPLVPGDGVVPTVNTAYGRISNVICFDGDFPYLSRQAGQAHADLMLVPSNDWRAIDPWHTQDITFRAIENGFSLVRQTSNGLAMAVDYEGRVLASSDYFATGEQVMIAQVPVKGVQTIYALIGDLFAWLCMAGLILLVAFALVLAHKRRAIERMVPDDTAPVADSRLVGSSR